MALEERKGDWIKERFLGSGGFGEVHLWRNEETDEKLAIKRCIKKDEMTPRQLERWQFEVQKMRELDHENVIAAEQVPDLLAVHDPELPLLAMEYCSGGDLRKVLNQPENCCGLQEFAIRCLVKDIASAIEYLHGKKIIHRDIKPENILLKPEDGKIVYKIVDLGYAKQLDQGSMCTSFVGTLQYLAPELISFLVRKCVADYNRTVDYWSFGTVVFECIAGFRPFLPNMTGVQWHLEVCKKTNKDISAQFDSRGDIKFSDVLPPTNNLSRSMQTYFVQWLCRMLQWKPDYRGGVQVKGKRPACFVMLDDILSVKVVSVFNVAKMDVLTYPVMDDHTVKNLLERVEGETKIPVDEQDLVLATGITPGHMDSAAEYWREPCEDETLVYLFRKGDSYSSTKFKALPPAVQSILKDCSSILPYEEQKKAWAESVHFCQEQSQDYKRMILSQRAAMLSLTRKCTMLVQTKNSMMNEMDQLMAKIQFFKASLNHDMMFYKQLEKEGTVSSDGVVTKWMKMDKDTDSFKTLKEKVSELEQEVITAHKKFAELQKSSFGKVKYDEAKICDTLDKLAKAAVDAYGGLRKTGRGTNQEALRDQKEMVTIVVKCIDYRDRKLTDLFTYLGKICCYKKEFSDLLPKLEKYCEEIRMDAEKVLGYQKQRQTSVWRLQIDLHQNKHNQDENQSSNPSPLYTDTTLVCRQEYKASNGSGTGNPLQSFGSSLESMKVMEESRTTNKMFEETINSLMQEHEEFTSLISEV